MDGASSYNSSTWFNATYAATLHEYHRGRPSPNPLMGFSATCIEFGRELIDTLGGSGKAPPIGLIQSAVGGTIIEVVP